jgi:ribosomal protein S18 acetylase RimI-like enzyme
MSDVPVLAALHVATFNETHGSFNSPTLETRLLQWQHSFQAKQDWFCYVIEKIGEGLIGFAKGQAYSHADQPAFSGELNKIYLLGKYHRQGLGRKLVCKVATEFIRRGITSMLLFGDADNPSNRFYERMGAEKLFAANGDFHGGYGWNDLHKLLAQCSELI